MGERFIDRQASGVLWTAALLSVAAHALVGVLLASPLGLGFGDSDGDVVETRAELLTPARVRVGEARGSSTAIAWLGYEEYRRHVAEPWLQDQAAFTPAAAVPGPLPPGAEPMPAEAEMTAAEPAPMREGVEATAASASAEAAEAERAVEQSALVPEFDAAVMAGAMRTATDRARDLAASTITALGEAGRQLVPAPARAEAALPDASVTDAEALRELVGPPAPEPKEAVAEVAEAEVPDEDGDADADRVSSESARPVVTGSPGSGRPGEVQDRESIAASIERATQVEWGRPLAAAGLRIETRAPQHITPLTRATTRPRDPVVRVFFGADGRVREAIILRSSGHQNIDQPILDAVYEWRASGKPLNDLDAANKDATLAVDFRIAL